jgi:hypothetical protein
MIGSPVEPGRARLGRFLLRRAWRCRALPRRRRGSPLLLTPFGLAHRVRLLVANLVHYSMRLSTAGDGGCAAAVRRMAAFPRFPSVGPNSALDREAEPGRFTPFLSFWLRPKAGMGQAAPLGRPSSDRKILFSFSFII